MVKELSSDPPSCLVTYITRVDLKGEFLIISRLPYTHGQCVKGNCAH